MRIALAMCAFIAVDELLCLRLHKQGVMQGLLGVINSLAYVLGFPGAAANSLLTRCPTEHIAGANWVLYLGCNFVLYFIGLCTLARVKHLFQPSRRVFVSQLENASSEKPVNLNRRRLFKKTFDIAAGCTMSGAMGYSLVMEPGEIRITNRKIGIRDLPTELNGLRLAQVSDVHHGPWLSIEHVREVVRRTNELEADMVLLTGDYVYASPVYIEPVVAELAKIKSRIGMVGILGNHDWWDRGVPMKKAFADNGINLIDNSRVFISSDRKLKGEKVLADSQADGGYARGLWIAGVGDLWEDLPDYHAALHGIPEQMPRLLLAHNPDAAEDPKFLAGKYRVDLMISGHTHGGQVRLPGIGAVIVPSKFGQKYAQGLVQSPTCPVFVSKGIGLSGLPVRFGVPPEIVVLELERA